MLARHLGLVFGGHIGGANPGDFVGGDGHTDSAATYQHAHISPLGGYIFSHQPGKVGIVDRVTGKRTFVTHLNALSSKPVLYFFLQFITGMVSSQCYPHVTYSTFGNADHETNQYQWCATA